MKVLHVISDSNVGGAGVLLTTLLRNFDRERIQSVVALPKDSLLCPRIKALGIPAHSLRHAPDRLSYASVRELRQIALHEGVELIHANAALSARAAGKLLRLPVVHTRHCCYPVGRLWRSFPTKQLGGACNRFLSDRVIATADAAADNLRALGIPSERIEVILNGSEQIREVSEEELDAWRARLGIVKEDFTVGICARLEVCKGHTVFLEAARLTTERMPHLPWRFLIVGEGSLRAELEAQTKRMGIADTVRFTGFVEDMAPIYRLLRLNVNCSCGTETSCLAISEGMSASLPTVASDYGGTRAMLEGSEGGVLFPVGDANALADAICSVATDQEKEARMRVASRERYLQCYTARGMTERVEALYQSLQRER